ncbi:hypothetical protein ACOMHN_065825 [Nucella lapillus]
MVRRAEVRRGEAEDGGRCHGNTDGDGGGGEEVAAEVKVRVAAIDRLMVVVVAGGPEGEVWAGVVLMNNPVTTVTVLSRAGVWQVCVVWAGVVLMDNPAPGRPPQPQMVQTRIEVASPYAGWRLYFPDEGYSDHSPTVQKVQLFEKYFVSWQKLYNFEDIDVKGFVIIDYKELSSDPGVVEGCPGLDTELRDKPETVLPCLGLAIHQVGHP